MRVFGAPIGYLVDGGGWGDMTLTAAAARAGVRHMSTELAGGGQVTPAALRIAEGGVRRVLHALGVLTREPPRAEHTTRLMQLSGQDYYCYAPEPGLFEPLVELGAEIEAGAAAGAIHPHDTPWREPAIARFSRAGRVICKRVPGRVERGEIHLVAISPETGNAVRELGLPVATEAMRPARRRLRGRYRSTASRRSLWKTVH